MRYTLAEIDKLKELMSMKANTYHSRMLDIVESCRHIHNITDIAVKLGLAFEGEEKLLIGKDAVGNLKWLKDFLTEELNKWKKSNLQSIHSAEHPHDLVEIDEVLNKIYPIKGAK